MDDFVERIERAIRDWHGISVPNPQARRMAAELADVIKGFERQRGRLRFEDEPSSFEAALQSTKEPASKGRRR
jgi:hypothetical protein